MKEGFYSAIYAGQTNNMGIALLAFDTGIVCGIDVGGILYDGTYQYNERTDTIDANITLTVPPGVALVQGVPPQPKTYTMKIQAQLPRDLGVDKLQTVDTPAGPVNVVFRKVRDFPN